jgi:hypothetical protein
MSLGGAAALVAAPCTDASKDRGSQRPPKDAGSPPERPLPSGAKRAKVAGSNRGRLARTAR